MANLIPLHEKIKRDLERESLVNFECRLISPGGEDLGPVGMDMGPDGELSVVLGRYPRSEWSIRRNVVTIRTTGQKIIQKTVYGSEKTVAGSDAAG